MSGQKVFYLVLFGVLGGCFILTVHYIFFNLNPATLVSSGIAIGYVLDAIISVVTDDTK